MTIANQGVSLLESVMTAQAAQNEIGVRMMKKAQDVVEQEGAAMLQLIEQAPTPPPANGRLLDAYA